MEYFDAEDLTPDQSKALDRLLRALKPAQSAQGTAPPGMPFEDALAEARVFFVEIDPTPDPEPGSTRFVFEQGVKIWTSPEPLRTMLQIVRETGWVRTAAVSDEAMKRVADVASGHDQPGHGPGPRVAFVFVWIFAFCAVVLFSCGVCPAFPAGALARLRFEVPPAPTLVAACLSAALLLTLISAALYRYATSERAAVERSRRAYRSIRTLAQLCVDASELNLPDRTRRELLGEIVRISGEMER